MMNSVFLVEYYPVSERPGQSFVRLVGFYSTHAKAFEGMEKDYKRIHDSTIDMNIADMGVFNHYRDNSTKELGSYSIREYPIDTTI